MPALATACLLAATATVPVDFAREVRPILAARCLTCHGPDEAAREADLRLDERADAVAERRRGAAIVPGAPEASAMLARILETDPERRMPPPETGEGLTEREIEILRRWIAEGAAYAPHWAFTAPQRPAPPAVGRSAWVRTPVDRFVLARLDSEGLTPSPEADRATLLRRVHLDLVGLPPTPEEVDAFIADDAPGAFERRVDRLLASPHFGERWAAPWLDLARYADTKGYEADRRRTMWPWRDWVIEAINADLPFDVFTIEQIAGDLLPDATDAQRLATGFHRNTMTNDEGGTDDEEYRAAAVVDRVNTTMQAWMGLTAGCAQCHSHKYDPLSHREFFRLYAFFDQTRDADRMDEAPLLEVMTPAQRAALAELDSAIAAAERAVDAALATSLPPIAEAEADEREHLWIDDLLPAGAAPTTDGIGADWIWSSARVRRGRRALALEATGPRQLFFNDPWVPLEVREGDVLFAHVWIEPGRAPRELMLQFRETGGSWEHRAIWGEDLIGWGAIGTDSRRRLGDVPEAGAWVRLEVPAEAVGLAPGMRLGGWAFTQHGGSVVWDAAGVRSREPREDAHRRDRAAWEDALREHGSVERLEPAIRAILERAEVDRTPEQREALATFHRRRAHAPTRLALLPHEEQLDALRRERRAMTGQVPRVPVMVELPAGERRETRLHEGGSYLNPGAPVTAGVPAVLHPLPADAVPDRLALARWIVDPANPLTARVAVNRWWEQLFGAGLVTTLDDFGTQGDLPSHPALLDWLATELVRLGWSRKAMLRTIVTSATYRQSSHLRPGDLDRDPRNRLLARASRLRLGAEAVRDQALAVSGLLERRLGGPPVFPPQPEGLWQVVYSGDTWTEAEGPDRYRRALYTFLRRTSPYPSFGLFDAPSRETCSSRRIRTNTPLQALVTLNDPAYLEPALGLARRMMLEAGPAPRDRATRGWRLCLGRAPAMDEVAVLLALHAERREHYARRAEEAAAFLAAAGRGALTGAMPADLDDADLAAWTLVANVLLNLDEFLTRE